MSNLEKMPNTLGKISQQMTFLKQATADVWSRLAKSHPKSMYSVMSENIIRASHDLRELNKQSRQLDKLTDAREKLTTDGPSFLNSQYSLDKQTQKLKKQGIDTEKTPEERFILDIKKQLANDTLNTLRQQRPLLIEQKGAEMGTQYQKRMQKISQLKNVSASARAFAQPKLELAKSFLQPGADLQKGLSEVQSLLGLKKDDPRIAALRQQSLSMAASGHAPAQVVDQQLKLAKNGMNADQVLTQTPQALNGDTPVAQMAVLVKGDNLDGDITKLFASWDSIRINLFEGQSAALRQLTQTATDWLSTLNTWITDNPQLVNSLLGLALGVTGIIGGLGFLGSVIAPILSGVNLLIIGASLLGTVFTGAGDIMAGALTMVGGPVIALIAVIAGIGFAVVKLWEPIKAFVSGIIEGFSAAMGPVSEAFAPFKAALGWITDLFKPIKFTQDALGEIGNLGKLVGEGMAEVFITISEAFSQIGQAFSTARTWLDSLFGWSKADDIAVQDTDSPTLNSPISPTGGTLGLYQPAKPNVANTLSDNRATTVNLSFNATADTDKNQVQSWISEALDQQEWNKTNSRLSQFGYGGIYA